MADITSVIQKFNKDAMTENEIFNPGDSVKVYVKIKEGKRERIQIFEGIVISVSGEGIGRTFKVRKISYGVGVEKTFPLHSPLIEKIEITRKGHVKRSKLYYLRDRIGKKAQVKEKKYYR